MKALLISSSDPTGKVFGREELALLAELCQRWNAVVVTERDLRAPALPGSRWAPAAPTVPGLETRTVTINAFSKTYTVTGWRVV